jgi:tetratricopeptide (TPR) repeat protein
MPLKSPVQYIVLVAVICFGLHSCKEENSQTKYIPLLDRKDTLGKSSEWINVQTQFKDNMLAIEKDTNNYMAQLKLAEIYLNEARIGGNQTYYYHGALRMLNALIENKSAKPDFIFLAMTYKASVLLSLHQFTEAKKIAEAAYSINQNNADVLGVLVDESVELGNYTGAISYCDKMMMLRPDLRSYSRAYPLRNSVFRPMASFRLVQAYQQVCFRLMQMLWRQIIAIRLKNSLKMPYLVAIRIGIPTVFQTLFDTKQQEPHPTVY